VPASTIPAAAPRHAAALHRGPGARGPVGIANEARPGSAALLGAKARRFPPPLPGASPRAHAGRAQAGRSVRATTGSPPVDDESSCRRRPRVYHSVGRLGARPNGGGRKPTTNTPTPAPGRRAGRRRDVPGATPSPAPSSTSSTARAPSGALHQAPHHDEGLPALQARLRWVGGALKAGAFERRRGRILSMVRADPALRRGRRAGRGPARDAGARGRRQAKERTRKTAALERRAVPRAATGPAGPDFAAY